MSEIAERLDVGAKAILGHLELLERAGMIEANVDEQRRKYFHITDNLRLEVNVTPYSFEVEITTVAVLPPQHELATNQAVKSLRSLYSEIHKLAEKRLRVMQEYQDIQGEITGTMGRCMEVIEDVADDHLEAEILYALLKGPMNKRMLSMKLGIPEYVLEGYIEKMEYKDVLKRDENNYIIG